MITEATSTTLVVPTSPAELAAAGYLARYGKATRDNYRIHLRQWFEWCGRLDCDPLKASRFMIEAWARHLAEDLDRKPQTVACKLNAVCGFYRFAHLDQIIEHDPGVHVRRPKIEFVSSTNGLTRPEFADVIQASRDDTPTAHALVLLLGYNGLRVSEALGVDIEHLGHTRGYSTLFLPHRKGGSVATLSLAIPTIWAINQCVGERTEGPVLVGRDGQRLSRSSATRTVQRLCRKSGITKRISPHSFRHTFVTMALDAGVPTRDLMDSTGHRSPKMIQFYDRNRGGIERNATHTVAAFVGAAM